MSVRVGKHLIANCYGTIHSWWERCIKTGIIPEKVLRDSQRQTSSQLGIVSSCPQLCLAFLEWHFGSLYPFRTHLGDLDDAGSVGEPCQVMVEFGPKSLSFCNDCKSCFWLRSSKKVRQLGFCGMKTKGYPNWGVLGGTGHSWRRLRCVVMTTAAIHPIKWTWPKSIIRDQFQPLLFVCCWCPQA